MFRRFFLKVWIRCGLRLWKTVPEFEPVGTFGTCSHDCPGGQNLVVDSAGKTALGASDFHGTGCLLLGRNRYPLPLRLATKAPSGPQKEIIEKMQKKGYDEYVAVIHGTVHIELPQGIRRRRIASVICTDIQIRSEQRSM